MPRKLSSPSLALLLLLSVSLACDRLYFRQEPADKGGLLLLIAIKDANPSEQTIASTISIIERRCNQLAIYCKVQRQAGGQIELRVSGDMQPARVKEVLFSQGLELRAVVSNPSPAPLESYATEAEAKEAAGANRDVLPYYETDRGSPGAQRRFIVVERKPIVTGEHVRDARAVPAPVGGNYQITFSLNPTGAYELQSWTRTHINNYLAIVLNGEARSVAYVQSEISDSGVITGRYTKEQAEDISRVLVTGNLPAPVEVIKESTYKP